MGISINIAMQMARNAHFLEGKTEGIMLGRQKMHFRPKWKNRLVQSLRDELDIETTEDELFQEDGFCESFLKTIKWPALKSLDFSDIEGAEYVHDLTKPIGRSLRKKFDVIYDGGTTEHVFDIAMAFRNVHRMLKDGGVFISCVGTDGWFGHGFYQVGPDVPWRFFGATLGYDVLKCCTFNRTDREPPRDIPDPTLSPRGAEHRYDNPQFIFYVVQKRGEKRKYPPTIQSHYVNY
ncbi:class I SAM-dependent methyltransferase [uncultured Shimia sp.]|uniref:class I SAM-dependent methyltransferase n=1 Tax=uncultured Shimia sp. TaxID=573152 RepID=UPI002625CAC5|nr:class I SAM-dependent methyltransferase [uncultured Shimia sp.]